MKKTTQTFLITFYNFKIVITYTFGFQILYWILSFSIVTQEREEENAITESQALNGACFFLHSF